MAHGASGGRGLTGDRAHPRRLLLCLHKFPCRLFRVAADLPDHDDGFGFRIAVEKIERIQKTGSNYRIAADADGGRLSNAALGELMHRLVSKRARARNDSDGALFVNRSGHNSDLALAGGNDAGTIRSD